MGPRKGGTERRIKIKTKNRLKDCEDGREEGRKGEERKKGRKEERKEGRKEGRERKECMKIRILAVVTN